MSKELFENTNANTTNNTSNTSVQANYNLIYENNACVNSGNICLVCKKNIDIKQEQHICLFRKNTCNLIIK